MSEMRLISKDTLKSIGNAIRAKNGKTESIQPQDMAAEIEAIESGESNVYGIKHGGAEIVLFPVYPTLRINIADVNRITASNLYHGSATIATIVE